jgi:putative endonuclease
VSRKPRPWRQRLGSQAHRRGHAAEWLAAAWLLLKGYQILCFRLKAAGAEIDILARKGGVLALVEVKQRPSFDAALEALGPDQRRRLLGAGQALIQGRRSLQGLDLRLDVMAVVPGRWPRHFRNLDAG